MILPKDLRTKATDKLNVNKMRFRARYSAHQPECKFPSIYNLLAEIHAMVGPLMCEVSMISGEALATRHIHEKKFLASMFEIRCLLRVAKVHDRFFEKAVNQVCH
jgi:hypothetical protein